MKITDIKFAMLKAPLRSPFKTAIREVAEMEDVVVIIETDIGKTGYGGAPSSAAITGDTHASIIEAIKVIMKPALLDKNIANLNELTEIIQSSMVNNYNAKAAVEIALYDLFAQLHEVPLYKILGGGKPTLSTDITISVDHVDKMVQDSLSAIVLGFETLKIKVGKNINLDIERVKAISAATKGQALLRLDANQGWTAKEAVYAIRHLEDSGVNLELVEQPVRSDDIKGMKAVTQSVRTPIMADESAFGPKRVIELIEKRAADIINIKLMKTGGISNAIRIADIAAIYEVECMIGCMLESSISVAAAAHFAVAKSNIVNKIDLDSPSLCLRNPVTSNVLFNHSKINICEGQGLGIKKITGLVMLDI